MLLQWLPGNMSRFDGAKGEPATILVLGEGPATSTPFAPPPAK